MKPKKYYCPNHPDKAAINICHNCKKLFCSDCLEEGPTYYYCHNTECNEKLKEEIYYSTNPVFCPNCISSTTSESAGEIHSVNGFGFRFGNKRDLCPWCNSYVQNKYFSLFFIPIIKIGSYRVKSWSKNYGLAKVSEQYISRKVR